MQCTSKIGVIYTPNNAKNVKYFPEVGPNIGD